MSDLVPWLLIVAAGVLFPAASVLAVLRRHTWWGRILSFEIAPPAWSRPADPPGNLRSALRLGLLGAATALPRPASCSSRHLC